MANSTEQVNLFLDSEYAKNAQILRNGELFTVVHREEANVTHAIENLERVAENQQKQQADAIKRKYQVKIDSLLNLQNKLKMYLKNPSMLKSDDITRIASMLDEMHGLLNSQKDYEIQASNNEVERRNRKSVEDYKQRAKLVVEKHLEDAQTRLSNMLEAFAPLEDYYETASLASPIWNELRDAHTFPVINSIRTADIKIDVNGEQNAPISYTAPEIQPFFNRRSLAIIYTNGERNKLKNLLDGILIRCLMSAEAGNVLFHFMDGNGNGSLFFDYLKCSDKTLEIFGNRINVSPREIEECLVKLQMTYKEIDQKIRKGESISQYNKRNPKSPLPYHVVVMDSFPLGMSSSYLPFIERMMNDELAAGLQFIFLVEEQRYYQVADILKAATVYRIPQNYVTQERMTDLLRKVLCFVDQSYNIEKSMLFEEYYRNIEWWKDSCSNFTRIPLGLNYSNNYDMLFDEEGQGNIAASASAVIAGMPGCGKSSMLNTLIMGASIVYSPNELHFIMIDMKGVGFKQYASEKLPHAEFIALKANPEYGLQILRNVRKLGKERQEMFVSRNIKNYDLFRKRFPNEVLPRYVIVIDEYQELLRGDTRNEALLILDYIVRVLRYSGFNLILSSQSMNLPLDITDNISHKIVMRCSTSVARDVFGKMDEYAERAPMLNRGQAIISCAGTDVIQTYYLPDDENNIPTGGSMSCASYLKLIRERWNAETQGNYDHHMVVFDSDTHARLTNNRLYKSLSYDPDRVVKELLFSPGERYMVDGTDFTCRLTRNKGENILVLCGRGGKLDVSLRTANTTFSSILPQLDSQNTRIDIVSYQNKSEREAFEAIHLSSEAVCNRFAHATFNELPESIDALLDSIFSDMENRKQQLAKGVHTQPRLLMIYRADLCEQLGKVEIYDDYEGTKMVESEQLKRFLQILEEGPQTGIHTLLHFTDTESCRRLLADGDELHLEYFAHRILLQMSVEDSHTFLNSYVNNDAAQLVDNEAKEEFKYNLALYKNAFDNSESVKLKPYAYLN